MVNFEDLDVWKCSARLSAELYKELINFLNYAKDSVAKFRVQIDIRMEVDSIPNKKA